MGEMCDFEAEFYPGNWPQASYGRNGKTRRAQNKKIVLSVNADTYAKYKAIGGAKVLKQMIVAAAVVGCWVWACRVRHTLL